MSIKPVKIPGVGMRNVKTALAAAFCALAYYFIGRSRRRGAVHLLFNTPVESYVSYALYRIFDTTIGVLVAWAVSYVFPRGWMQLWQERFEALKAG